MELGVQPLDALMEEHGLNNHRLVAASGEHLTHKVVGKARRGRRLTVRGQKKVLDAFNRCVVMGEPLTLTDLFNYKGK